MVNVETLVNYDSDSCARSAGAPSLANKESVRPRKLQRGQKKKKRVQRKSQQDTPIDNARDSKSVDAQNDSASRATEDRSGVTRNVLPQRRVRSSRKQKDGYDLTQSASEVTLQDATRLKVAMGTKLQSHRIVSRPTSKTGLQKRSSEINQLKRRYGDSLEVDDTLGKFILPFVPSDPDFPYELPDLRLQLVVPDHYPDEPVLLTIHQGLTPGFARNIERAFVEDKIGYGVSSRGIMGMLTWLDRNIERLLGMKESETLKIIRHQHLDVKHTMEEPVVRNAQTHLMGADQSQSQETYTQQQLDEAALTRNLSLSKLRMIHPSKLDNDSFDLDLTETTRVRLQVPKLFPLAPAWLMILKGDVSIEQPANDILRENTRGLSRTINWLAANLTKLAPSATVISNTSQSQEPPSSVPAKSGVHLPEHADYDGFVLVANQVYSVPADSVRQDSQDSSSGDDYDEMSEAEGHFDALHIKEQDHDEPINQSKTTNQTQDKGTAINASITLTHIALLEPIFLSLNLKCLRCKSTGNHIASVHTGKSADVQCPTCSSLLTVSFRGQALHQGNSRIGYLDLVGASVLDLGPGSFSPTCEKCDVVGVAFKGLVAGQPQTRPCRACFIKQTVSITTTSFLVINSSVKAATTGSREAQNLNLQRGKPLPANGVCKHYRKSNRWFRFSCCNKVYACDLCHEALTDHEMELARFQICGWCSKESAIRGMKPCVHCGRDLTRRSRGGFWEGGQGTRDQSKMNRNDPRKHRKKL